MTLHARNVDCGRCDPFNDLYVHDAADVDCPHCIQILADRTVAALDPRQPPPGRILYSPQHVVDYVEDMLRYLRISFTEIETRETEYQGTIEVVLNGAPFQDFPQARREIQQGLDKYRPISTRFEVHQH